VFEILLIYLCHSTLVLEKDLTEKNKLEKDADKHLERYMIFHALFQALKEKERKDKKE